MSVNFDERSGVVPCKTAWGCWYQTMEEVFIEVQVPPGTPSRDIRCKLGIRDIALTVRDTHILQGRLYDATISDESTWTLEDKKTYPNSSNQVQPGCRQLLAVLARRRVLRWSLGARWDAKETDAGAISEREPWIWLQWSRNFWKLQQRGPWLFQFTKINPIMNGLFIFLPFQDTNIMGKLYIFFYLFV